MKGRQYSEVLRYLRQLKVLALRLRPLEPDKSRRNSLEKMGLFLNLSITALESVSENEEVANLAIANAKLNLGQALYLLVEALGESDASETLEDVMGML